MPEAWGPVDPLRFTVVAATLLCAGLAGAALRPAAVVARARWILVAVALVSLASAAVLVRTEPPGLRLRIDPSTEALLPAGDPAVARYRESVRDFGDDQVFVVAMECDDVFRAEHLGALRRVGDAISRIDGVRRVVSLARVTSFRYDPEHDWIEVRPFLEDEVDAPGELAALRARALADPVYRRNLVSDDGRTAALNVSFRPMTDREFIAADIDGRIAGILARETRDGRRFYVSGRPHIKTRMYHTMTRDLAVLIPVTIGLVALVVAGVAGTLRGIVLPVANVALAILWTFAVIALLDRPLTVLTVLLAPTLIAIGSVYGVHVVNRYEEESAAGGEPDEVVLRALLYTRLPVLVAGLTTMVGYAALLVTDVPAVFEIGAFSIFGVAGITLMTLTGLPAALTLLRVRPAGEPRFGWATGVRARLDALLAGVTRWACARPRAVMRGFAVLTAAAAAAIPFVTIDTDYLSFFDPDTPVRRDFERINQLLAGAVPLYVVVRGGEPGALRDPELLRRLERLQERMDAVPGVSRSLSLLETLRLLNRALENGDPAEERIPDSREAVTELFFMVPKADLLRFATVDQSSANLIVRTGTVGSAAMRELTGRLEALLADPALEGVDAFVTGNAVLLNRAADGVARSQPLTVALAAGTIFVLLSWALGSPRLGAVAMVPNLVPVMFFFGLLGAGVAPLSLPTSLIASVALGIAIDATAHYLVRYRAERRRGCSPEEAVARTGLRVGRPVAIAAVMLMVGFGSVMASEFATLRQFGMLSAVTMGACAVTDLVLLPALLVRWRL